ncbi:hypothetical protein [Mesomycoplasma ovipneumoniae]|uniref:hypothetical protein n=1 Tax=Mesomycoplasma ovipneumoniae TaxID=29562 RepID=UPI00296533AC|nr:hypothetical protein [Mesomycoplasma ovipneumoniae]MDW2910186.1 hypothetical protein [Mesomycoplasma ovipneumoniae]MDW2910405.1 hypothetical protein [Mesomycoplasma ovipneumoniae]MDW2917482.1 hypothetical protein [Mesomycoplasma ovipneumoniae]
MNFITLFQQQNTQNGLNEIKNAVNNLSSNTLNLLTIIFGSLVGILGAAMIIYIIVLLLQAKFANLEKKQQIYKRLKSGIIIIGVIVILLVAGASITAALNNLWSSFAADVGKLVGGQQSPAAAASVSELIQNVRLF